MKILFICNEYPPSIHGGIGTFVLNLAKRLTNYGHSVHVIGFDRQVERDYIEKDGNVFVNRLRLPIIDNSYAYGGPVILIRQILERIYLSSKVRKYCKHQSIDVVESYDWSGPLWYHPGVPLLVRMHGANSAYAYYEKKIMSRFLFFIERKNISMADALVGVSDHVSLLTLRAFRLQNKPYQVIYNGVDTAIFYPQKRMKKNNAQVLYAGSVSRRKGIYELFNAMNFVFQKVPRARFMIVGRLPVELQARDSLMNELLSLLKPSYRKQVTFMGARPYSEMPDLYNQSTCAVFPSLAEAYGLTCVEAMACGVPVVMTSLASGPEIVEDGISGFLRDPRSPNGLSDAIVSLLCSQSLRIYMSKNALMRVKSKFDLDKVVHQNIAVYEGLLK
jgi:glycosyltransferase involved in cell wall biosynthesis